MSTFEWTIALLAVVGFVLPVWVFLGVFLKRQDAKAPGHPSIRYFAYTSLLSRIHGMLMKEKGKVQHGPIFAATIRELREYPEYRDISLLFLEEITITGSKKFDGVLKNELNAVEAELLEARSD